jgi:hypothetical protein
MEPKISKAQKDVWEWKEKAYERLKHLPVSEQLLLIREQTRDSIARIKRKKARNKVLGSSSQ